jgi:hypothetical protein
MRIKRAFNDKRITFAGCMARPRSASGFLLGNLGGNAQRTRHTFTKAFVEADFHEGGAEAIAKVRKEQPAAYMKTCALMVPREHKVEHRNPLSSLTDEELDQPSRSSSKCWRSDPARALLAVGESPKRKPSDDPDTARYPDKNLLETPSLALADASRETLRMGDVVELMLRQITRCAELCGMRRTA